MEYTKLGNTTFKKTESKETIYDIGDLLSKRIQLEEQLAETNALINQAQSIGVSIELQEEIIEEN